MDFRHRWPGPKICSKTMYLNNRSTSGVLNSLATNSVQGVCKLGPNILGRQTRGKSIFSLFLCINSATLSEKSSNFSGLRIQELPPSILGIFLLLPNWQQFWDPLNAVFFLDMTWSKSKQILHLVRHHLHQTLWQVSSSPLGYLGEYFPTSISLTRRLADPKTPSRMSSPFDNSTNFSCPKVWIYLRKCAEVLEFSWFFPYCCYSNTPETTVKL